jgi:hypothetical protein
LGEFPTRTIDHIRQGWIDRFCVGVGGHVLSVLTLKGHFQASMQK